MNFPKWDFERDGIKKTTFRFLFEKLQKRSFLAVESPGRFVASFYYWTTIQIRLLQIRSKIDIKIYRFTNESRIRNESKIFMFKSILTFCCQTSCLWKFTPNSPFAQKSAAKLIDSSSVLPFAHKSNIFFKFFTQTIGSIFTHCTGIPKIRARSYRLRMYSMIFNTPCPYELRS